MLNSVFHFSYHPLKWSPPMDFAYRFEVGTFLCKMTPVSTLYAKQFPCTSINPEKNGQKRPFLDGRVQSFARSMCFIVNRLYSRPISPLSNRVYRMSLRLSVVNQTARDLSGAARFCTNFRIFRFQCWTNDARLHVPAAPHWSQRNQNLIKPVESRDPPALKKNQPPTPISSVTISDFGRDTDGRRGGGRQRRRAIL